jgi:Transposase, Mutator family
VARPLPKAVDCLLSNLSALTAHLHFPVEQRERIRHSNLLERTFGETRRRVKVIGRLPGEHSCLSLVWAVLDRSSSGWRGVDTPSPVSAGCRIPAASYWVRPSSAPLAERPPFRLDDAARRGYDDVRGSSDTRRPCCGDEELSPDSDRQRRTVHR